MVHFAPLAGTGRHAESAKPAMYGQKGFDFWTTAVGRDSVDRWQLGFGSKSPPLREPFPYKTPYKSTSLQKSKKEAFRNSLLRKALQGRGDKIRTCDLLNPIRFQRYIDR